MNFSSNVGGRLGGEHRKFSNLEGNHGEAASSATRASRLDFGIQRKQVRLLCYGSDGLDQWSQRANITSESLNTFEILLEFCCLRL